MPARLMNVRFMPVLFAALSLGACETLRPAEAAPDITLDEAPYIEALYLSGDPGEDLLGGGQTQFAAFA